MNKFTFKGFEGYADAIKGAQIKITLSTRDCPGWAIDCFEINGLRLQIGRTPKRHIAEGCSDSRGVNVYFPFVNAAVLRANGEWMDDTTVQLIGPNAEFCHNVGPHVEWFAVTVPLDLVTGRCHGFEDNLLSTFDRSARLLRPEAAALARLRCLVKRISCAWHSAAHCLPLPLFVAR